MELREAAGLDAEAEYDPTSPLVICGVLFGEEAAQEFGQLLENPTHKHVRTFQDPVGTAQYLKLEHHTGEVGEWCFPRPGIEGEANIWPTAVEVALVHCCQKLDEETFRGILSGNIGFLLYDDGFPPKNLDLVPALRSPVAGPTHLTNNYTSIAFSKDIGEINIDKVIRSFAQSAEASPLKYRFVELYRVFETLYLRDAFDKFASVFFAEPERAVHGITQTMKSERAQLHALAEPLMRNFEDIFDLCELERRTHNNRFLWAIYRSMERNYKGESSANWKSGSNYIYAIRCSIVHAGEKDVVFEDFNDGDRALEQVVPLLELAALAMIGVTMSA